MRTWLALVLVIAIASMIGVANAETNDEVAIQAGAGNATVPVVVTGNSSQVSCTVFLLYGNITDTGNSTIDQRGFVYDTVCEPDPGNATAPAASAWDFNEMELGSWNTTGVYSDTVSGLDGNTTYYYRAVVHNVAGYWDYGDKCDTFTTCEQCEPPSDLTASIAGNGTVTLMWTAGNGSVSTIIRLGIGACPGNYTEGFLVYNGNGTNTTHDVLDTDEYLCFRAWSICANSTYSDDYTEAILAGGGVLMYIGFFMLTLGLSWIAFRGRYILWNIAAALSWVGLWMYVSAVPPTGLSEGSPAQMVIMLVCIAAAVAIMIWGLGFQVRVQRKYGEGFNTESSSDRFKFMWEKDGEDEMEERSRMRTKSAEERRADYRARTRRAYRQDRRRR